MKCSTKGPLPRASNSSPRRPDGTGTSLVEARRMGSTQTRSSLTCASENSPILLTVALFTRTAPVRGSWPDLSRVIYGARRRPYFRLLRPAASAILSFADAAFQATPIMPASRRASIFASSKPTSASTARVCWPATQPLPGVVWERLKRARGRAAGRNCSRAHSRDRPDGRNDRGRPFSKISAFRSCGA